jgi:hypothetical protein
LDLGTALGLIAGVLVVSALAAGLVERAPLSFQMLFLSLGFVVGDRGLGLISIALDSRLLEAADLERGGRHQRQPTPPHNRPHIAKPATSECQLLAPGSEVGKARTRRAQAWNCSHRCR